MHSDQVTVFSVLLSSIKETVNTRMAERVHITQKISFSNLKKIIASNELDLLGRSEEQDKEYQLYQDRVRAEWVSTEDSILASKFNFKVLTGAEGKKYVVKVPLAPGTSIQSCIINDYPYYFEEDIVHFVLWKLSGPPGNITGLRGMTTAGSGSDEGETEGDAAIFRTLVSRPLSESHEVSLTDVEEAIAELRSKYNGLVNDDSCNVGGDGNVQCVRDVAWFANPTHLKSIPQVSHVHILLQLEPCRRSAIAGNGLQVFNVSRHRLKNGPTAAEEQRILEDVFACSCKWFGVEPDAPGVEPADIRVWRQRLLEKRGEILYCAETGSPGGNRVYRKDSIRGFLFCYQREAGGYPLGREIPKRHVWIAATDPEFGRRGIMAQLFRHLETNISVIEGLEPEQYPEPDVISTSDTCIDNKYINGGSGATNKVSAVTVTVNTYPKRFPYMYKFLEKHGYTLSKVVPATTAEDEDGDKFCYEKTVPVSKCPCRSNI